MMRMCVVQSRFIEPLRSREGSLMGFSVMEIARSACATMRVFRKNPSGGFGRQPKVI